MATEKPDTFDAVDWDAISGSRGPRIQRNTLGLVVSSILLWGLFAYDYLIVPARANTFDAVGWEQNLATIDYLFAFTIIVFVFYGLVPLYQNPRMTKYYWKEFRRNRPAVLSLAWLGLIFVGGLVGPAIMDPPTVELFNQYQPPVFLSIDSIYVIECAGPTANSACQGSWAHPLGTTGSGEDIFTAIVYGMQISMKIGFIATFIVMIIGTSVGTVSAYTGGIVDEVLMRYVDIQQSFPTFLLYLLILYIFGGSLALFIVLFGLFSWGGMARYVRSKALSVAEEEYIQAVKISGASSFGVVRRHMVPNSASSIITDITLLIPAFILFETQLAFLGLGDSEVYSWGQLISIGRNDLAFAPWIVLAPGLFLFLTILSFNFLGDALLDALNPEAEAENE